MFVVRCLQCCDVGWMDDVAVLLCRVVLFAVGYVFKTHRGTSIYINLEEPLVTQPNPD